MTLWCGLCSSPFPVIRPRPGSDSIPAQCFSFPLHFLPVFFLKGTPSKTHYPLPVFSCASETMGLTLSTASDSKYIKFHYEVHYKIKKVIRLLVTDKIVPKGIPATLPCPSGKPIPHRSQTKKGETEQPTQGKGTSNHPPLSSFIIGCVGDR